MPSQDSLETLQSYHELVDFLEKNKRQRFSFEILRFAGPQPQAEGKNTLLIDDTAIGIRKSDLVKVYLIARLVLLHQAAKKNGYHSAPVELPKPLQQFDSRQAARVALLYDPEHLTAANFLKRSLQDESIGISDRLAEEINFVDSVLTSPLHKHSKSPTLWSHRLWLMTTFKPWERTAADSHISISTLDASEQSEVALDATSLHFSRELDIVLAAAEQHERNYYAFQYIRKLLGCLFPTHAEGDPTCSEADVLPESLQRLTKWCLAHPRDISGLTCLSWMLACAHRFAELQPAVAQTLGALESFQASLQWKGESMRAFFKLASNVRLAMKITEPLNPAGQANA